MKFLDNNGLEYLADKITGLISGGGSADFIVEQGQSGYWTYRKWASGISECWGRWTATTTSWSAWGSVYEGNNHLANLSFPTGLFNAIPIVTAQVGLNGMSGGVMTEMGQVSQTSIGYVVPIRPNTFSQPLNYEYSIYAKGYWKTFTPGASAINTQVGIDNFASRVTVNSKITTNSNYPLIAVRVGKIAFIRFCGSANAQITSANTTALLTLPYSCAYQLGGILYYSAVPATRPYIRIEGTNVYQQWASTLASGATIELWAAFIVS